MSHVRIKTTFEVSAPFGTTETKTLYAHHNNSCDVVTFYDDSGKFMFSFEDTMPNSLMHAIHRLCELRRDLMPGVEFMNDEDVKKCNL